MVDYFGRSTKLVTSQQPHHHQHKHQNDLDDLTDVKGFSNKIESGSLYCFKATENGIYEREKLPYQDDISNLPDNVPLNLIKRNGEIYFEKKPAASVLPPSDEAPTGILEHVNLNNIPNDVRFSLIKKHDKLNLIAAQKEIEFINIPTDTIFDLDSIKLIHTNNKLKIIKADKNLLGFDFDSFYHYFNYPDYDINNIMIRNYGIIDCYLISEIVDNRILKILPIVETNVKPIYYFGEEKIRSNEHVDFPIEFKFYEEKEKELIASFPIGSTLTIEGKILEDKHHNKIVSFVSHSATKVWPDKIFPYSGFFKVIITRVENQYIIESKELYPFKHTLPFSPFEKIYLRSGYYIKSIVFKI